MKPFRSLSNNTAIRPELVGGLYITIALFASLILATASASAGEPVLSATAYGAIKFGAKITDIETKVSEHVAPPVDEDDAACRFVQLKAYPEAKFMVEDGVITRADVSEKAKNNLSILVGTPLGKVRAAHPTAKLEQHQYDPNGHYVIFKSADGKSAIVMEESEGKIVEVRGGLEPSVEYVEGCL